MILSNAFFLKLALIFSSVVFAKDRLGPCHTRSRQMTLIKNCYSGDMTRPLEGGAQFFTSTPVNRDGASYCYNSLVLVEQNTSNTIVKIHILKDSKDSQLKAYDYLLQPDEIRRLKKDAPLLSLKGPKGECFSPTGDREVCEGGLLKSFGLRDLDLPLVVAIGKANSGHYTISHLVSDANNIKLSKPKELEPVGTPDLASLTQKVLQEIRAKLVMAARQKMATLHQPTMTPKKLAETSEQFRYCSLALDGFLKEKRLPDPLSDEEKMTLAKLTSYMNGETAVEPSRLPASLPRKTN